MWNLPEPGIEVTVSCIGRWIPYYSATREGPIMNINKKLLGQQVRKEGLLWTCDKTRLSLAPLFNLDIPELDIQSG